MPLVCPICRDSLAGNINESEEFNIVAGECGHIFHRNCLSTWIDQDTRTANRCPCCRGTVTVSKFITLYPTTCNQTLLSELTDNSDKLNATIQTLKASLTSQNEEIVAKDLVVADLLNQLKTLTDKNKKLTAASKTWIKRSDENDRYKNLYFNLKARNERLETRLKRYKSVELISNCDQPCTLVETVNECCSHTAEKLINENTILSKVVQDSKARIGQLESNLEEAKSLYVDANVQLSGFVNQ